MSEVIMENDLAKVSRIQPHTYVMEYKASKLIDNASIELLRDFMFQFAEGPKGPGERRKFIVDGSNLKFLSAKALVGLIQLDKKLKERNDQLVITNLKPEIEEVFEITHLNRLFDIRTNMEEALASTGKGERSVV